MSNAASLMYKRQTEADIAHHRQRIIDIDNGLFSHFPKSVVSELRKQSAMGLENTHRVYNSACVEVVG